jgi:hypothetical protein
MTYAAGIHSIPAEVYHADALRTEVTLSSSLARVVLNQSPLHAWTAHPRLNPEYEPKTSDAFDIGRAAHRAILGAGGEFVAIPDALLSDDGGVRTKEARAWVNEARASGLTPLKSEKVEAIQAMADTAHDALRDYRIKLDPDRSELSALAMVNGVWCRAMVDNAPESPRLPLFDFKTCESADPDAVRRSIMAYGYDMQARFYVDAWQEATGQLREFWFIFQEKSAPFEVAVVSLSDLDMDLAGLRCTRARETWGECLRTGEYPGYPRQVLTLDLPEFYHQRHEARAAAETAAKPSREALDAARAWQAPQ